MLNEEIASLKAENKKFNELCKLSYYEFYRQTCQRETR